MYTYKNMNFIEMVRSTNPRVPRVKNEDVHMYDVRTYPAIHTYTYVHHRKTFRYSFVYSYLRFESCHHWVGVSKL